FWIAGGENLIFAWAKWTDWQYKGEVAAQWEHVDWEGFRFYDLIFPLFLFLVGVVLPFSLGKLRERGVGWSSIYGRVIRRTLLLFALGLIFYGFMQNLDVWDLGANLRQHRYVGVLQRIALCYLIAALIMLNTRVWLQALITVGIVIGYWALLAYVPSPQSGLAADYQKMSNLPGYVDAKYLPGKIAAKWYGFGDNEGILSTIPSVATTLMGVLAGWWLLSQRSGWGKALGLLLAGIVCLAAGYTWGWELPGQRPGWAITLKF